MEIKSLSKTSFDDLFETFTQAFAHYEVQLNKEELRTMLQRRGFNPALSFGAFEENRMVSFTCNGIGDFYGTLTAYDTGTGTLKSHQGKGLATQVFEYSIPFLKKAGVKSYVLEVLQHNTTAVSVYRKLGFKETREFYYFTQESHLIENRSKKINLSYELLPITLNDAELLSSFWDFRPSWQNSFESINRALKDFKTLGAFHQDRLIGYIVFEPKSGDVTQIAVDKMFRRKGIGTVLLEMVLNLNQCQSVKVINTDISSHSLTDFLKSKNIHPIGKQFEMIKEL